MANRATTTARHRQTPLIGLLQQVVGELVIVIIRPKFFWGGKQAESFRLTSIERIAVLSYTLVFVHTTSVSLNSQDFFRFFSKILDIGRVSFAKQAHSNTFALLNSPDLDSPDTDDIDESHFTGVAGLRESLVFAASPADRRYKLHQKSPDPR